MALYGYNLCSTDYFKFYFFIVILSHFNDGVTAGKLRVVLFKKRLVVKILYIYVFRIKIDRISFNLYTTRNKLKLVVGR